MLESMWGSFRPAGYFKVQGDKGREITDRVWLKRMKEKIKKGVRSIGWDKGEGKKQVRKRMHSVRDVAHSVWIFFLLSTF